MINNKHSYLVVIFLLIITHAFSQPITRIKHFGRNKGHLKMFIYQPPGMKSEKAALIVVLHGCLQCAGTVASQTGWNKLANESNFYVLYPEQRIINNPEKCFKWYKRKNIYKGRGENSSIKKMIEYMQSNYNIDSSKVFITGLSAGAAMSVIMMADYPETFNAGAIFAGAPYKVATSMIPAAMAFAGWRIKSPEKWGSYVRSQNPAYTGSYPRMIIYHGNNDPIVNKRNGVELMKQWTNVQHAGITPSETISHFLGNPDIERNAYNSSTKKEAVVFYKINNLSHQLPVDPGNCFTQGGRKGLFSKDIDFNSTLWTAYDFGLIAAPLITGKTFVKKDETGLIFSVPATSGASYDWILPDDCKITGDKNSGTIEVQWGATSGNIDLIVTGDRNCKIQCRTLSVIVE